MTKIPFDNISIFLILIPIAPVLPNQIDPKRPISNIRIMTMNFQDYKQIFELEINNMILQWINILKQHL